MNITEAAIWPKAAKSLKGCVFKWGIWIQFLAYFRFQKSIKGIQKNQINVIGLKI